MTTPHFGLEEITRGKTLADSEYKYSTTDRRLIDLLLFILFNHHHNGVQNSASALSSALDLEIDQTAGTLPAGQRIYYKYTLVDDNGIESLPSPEAFIDTPAKVAIPSAPTWEFLNAGGALLPGQYTYVLSAYKDSSTLETEARSFTSVSIAAGTNTNKITLTLPPLPAGADGFNVYRRKPNATVYAFMSSIDMTVITPPSVFVDDGSIVEDANRSAPTVNTTNAQNSVVVALPGATPTVPDGHTWRLYRSLISGVYTSSLVHHIVEQTSEGSGVILPGYTDLGSAAIAESPPTKAFPIGNPEPVQLTDGTEVQGVLPPAHLTYKDTVEFRVAGTLSARSGTETWRCPYDEAFIAFVRCSLGRGSGAFGADDIVDVNKYDVHAATPSWGSIFSEDQSKMPRVVVGSRASADKTPDVRYLIKDDELSYDIDQAGGAATPTDKDLLIQIVIYHSDPTTSTVVTTEP